MKKIEKRTHFENREVRLTSFIDDESVGFENELLGAIPGFAIDQTLKYLQNCSREYLLFQMRSESGTPAMQACIYVGRSRFAPWFGMASVPRLSHAKDGIEEEVGLRALKLFCAELPGIMSLRLQPLRYESVALMNFQARALRQGYHLVNPSSIVRSLVLDLKSSPEELMSTLGSRAKSKLRHKGIQRVEMRVLADPRYKDKCIQASRESHARSGSTGGYYCFDSAFSFAQKHPDMARIIGLFMKEKPEELLAYVIGFRHGNLAEFSSAGSFANPELRSIPFNSYLLWELMNWAREQGCTRIDLGGVTDGDVTDPLSGISRFKRAFCDFEMETGREVLCLLKPFRYYAYQSLKFIQSRVKLAVESKPKSNSVRLLPVYD